MKDFLVLRVVARFIIPYIILFSLCILLHGETSSGGGFQAGVIMAGAFILYGLIWGHTRLLKIASVTDLMVCASGGLFLYIITGLASLFSGGQFLNYNHLTTSFLNGQTLGIFLVEIGIGISVFASILLIFLSFVIHHAAFTQRNR